MLLKKILILLLSINLFSNELKSIEINIDKIFEDIDKNEFKAMKMGFKETFKTKVEFLDWNTEKELTLYSADKILNSALLYGKPETFFITYETKNNNIITYTCELTDLDLKKDKENLYIYDCFKITNTN